MKKTAFFLLLAGGLAACAPETIRPHATLFVGIDVSGSFHGRYDDAIEFLAHYLYGHLNGLGGLQIPRELFVGSIGGDFPNEPKSFHPIQDFQHKSVAQIQSDLRYWFYKSDRITDFNMFFKQVATICQKRNLALTPITVVLVSDGIPALPGPGDRPDIGHFDKIDLSPLEYLSRNVTVRLLYVSPTVAGKWESAIPRQRVRLWTVDDQVMQGWKGQVQPDLDLDKQDRLWKWVLDNVDYRVRAIRFRLPSKKA